MELDKTDVLKALQTLVDTAKEEKSGIQLYWLIKDFEKVLASAKVELDEIIYSSLNQQQ
jgi:hypothetical protein